MKKPRFWLVGSLVLVACVATAALSARGAMITHGTTTINMDFVTVGDPSNTGDVQSQGTFGAVPYTYRIGKYEVMADQWAAVIAADSNVGNAGEWSGSQPTAGTSWNEAAKFCNWLTTGHYDQGYYSISGDGAATPNTLSHDAYAVLHGTTYFIPTENEWYKAAYYDPHKSGGAGYWDYPTKQDYPPAMPDGIDFDGDTDFDAVFHQGYDQKHPNAVTNAGIASAYGTIAQGGNVWEWNEAASGTYRVVRGGPWSGNSTLLGAASRSTSLPTNEFSTYGFRVASLDAPWAVPEPTTLALWSLLGGLNVGAGWWRRRKSA